MHYQELESEKYLRQEIMRRHLRWRRARNRKAIRDFVTFLIGLVVIGLTFETLTLLPDWLVVIAEFLQDRGFISA